ncbi:MAG: GTP 3',8-cyclase MoaA [Bacillota bacterium]
MSLLDSGPRSIAAVKVLRIGLTDRCNFRCVYCMPEAGVEWLNNSLILSFDEIVEVVRVAADLHHIANVKLTGGEPTVRPGLAQLVRRLRAIGSTRDLSMTTNGMLLERLAGPLRDAGLDRVTVSIDSLRPDRFRRITRTGDLHTVLRGVDAACEAGFSSLKINCVAMRGINDDEFADFAALTVANRITVRFIEYMPLGDAVVQHAGVSPDEVGPAASCGGQDRGNVFVSEATIRARIEERLGPLIGVDRTTEAGAGPAKVYRLARGNSAGRIGFISAMSAPFCATCNRLRLTAAGVLRSCLFEGGEVDLKPLLRRQPAGGRRTAMLAQAMVDCIRLKPVVHGEHGTEQMSRIGG